MKIYPKKVTNDLPEVSKHLRSIHFIIVITCFLVLSGVLLSEEKDYERAINQAQYLIYFESLLEKGATPGLVFFEIINNNMISEDKAMKSKIDTLRKKNIMLNFSVSYFPIDEHIEYKQKILKYIAEKEKNNFLVELNLERTGLTSTLPPNIPRGMAGCGHLFDPVAERFSLEEIQILWDMFIINKDIYIATEFLLKSAKIFIGPSIYYDNKDDIVKKIDSHLSIHETKYPAKFDGLDTSKFNCPTYTMNLPDRWIDNINIKVIEDGYEAKKYRISSLSMVPIPEDDIYTFFEFDRDKIPTHYLLANHYIDRDSDIQMTIAIPIETKRINVFDRFIPDDSFMKRTGISIMQIPFTKEFPELNKFAKNISSLKLDQLHKELMRRKEEERSNIEILSVKIPGKELKLFSFLGILLLILYFYVHLKQYISLYSKHKNADDKTPWICLYKGFIPAILTFASLTIFPLSLSFYAIRYGGTGLSNNWLFGTGDLDDILFAIEIVAITIICILNTYQLVNLKILISGKERLNLTDIEIDY